MHNKIMNAYLLCQLLKELELGGYTEIPVKLTLDEQLLLYCYKRLDERDRLDILGFLSEKISH